jgi:hypothetical protein
MIKQPFLGGFLGRTSEPYCLRVNVDKLEGQKDLGPCPVRPDRVNGPGRLGFRQRKGRHSTKSLGL